MMFVSKPPIKVNIFDDRKIITLTENRIMFSHLDFLDQYLSMPVIGGHAKQFYYAPSVLQTLVLTDTTLQIYYCDWKTQIKLVRVAILHNQSVQSIYFDEKTGWHIHGSMLQYQPAKITFHDGSPRPLEKVIAECFVQRNNYMLTQNNLLKSECGQKLKQIIWKDKAMVMENTNLQVEMRGSQSSDHKYDVLCINSTYILVVDKYQVLYTIMEPKITLFLNSLLISSLPQQNLINVKKLNLKNTVDLGTIENILGIVKGAYLDKKELLLLNYQKNQLCLNSLQINSHLSEEAKQQNCIEKIKDSKKINDKNAWMKQLESKKESYYSKDSKAVIRDVQIDDEEIKPDEVDNGDSEVLSRSAIENNHDLMAQFQFQDVNSEGGDINVDNAHQKHSQKVKQELRMEQHNKSADYMVKKHHSMDYNIQKAESQRQSHKDNIKKYEKSKESSEKRSQSHPNQFKDTYFPFHQSADQIAETPIFGDFSPRGGGFTTFQHGWDEKVGQPEQIAEENGDNQDLDQSVDLKENERQVIKTVPGIPTKKCQYFLKKNIYSKQSMMRVENTSYCRLIENQSGQNLNKFEELVQEFLLNIIQQPQAPLFFADHIRTSSPELTQDKIRMLFHTILTKDAYKQKMTWVLHQFKICEVPSEVLNFPKDFVNVMKIICKDIYLEDLLKPTKETMSYILNSYFNSEIFDDEIVFIEDEQIDITHPRNILNILLYINEQFNLSISSILNVYCYKLLEHHNIDIVQKLLEDNVFEICEVSRSVLDDAIIERMIQLLKESVENVEYLWELLPLLSENVFDEYKLRLAAISQLNQSNIIYNLDMVINIKDYDVSLFSLFENIIEQNSCMNLINLKLDSVYRSMFWIQEGEKLKYATNQYVELVKLLVEKFMQKGYINEAFKYLETVCQKIKISYIARLIYMYMDGKLLNRLIDMNQPLTNISQFFPQIYKDKDITVKFLKRDPQKNTNYSESFACSWEKFKSVYNKYLSGPPELCYLTFHRINISYQMFSTLEQSQKKKFNEFLAQIEQSLIVELTDMNENDDSINPKGYTKIKFLEKPGENINVSGVETSQVHREDLLLENENSQKRDKIYKSMTVIEHYNSISDKKKVNRANSDRFKSHSSQKNEELIRLKLLVDKEQIMTCLQEIYETTSTSTFVRATYLVDNQRIPLYHIDSLKQIASKELQFQINRILPFTIFLIQNDKEAFDMSSRRIRNQLNIQNFWIIYMLMEYMFGQGVIICQMLLEKIVVYYRCDDLAQIIEDIFQTATPKFKMEFLRNMKNSAYQYKLPKTCEKISRYMQIMV